MFVLVSSVKILGVSDCFIYCHNDIVLWVKGQNKIYIIKQFEKVLARGNSLRNKVPALETSEIYSFIFQTTRMTRTCTAINKVLQCSYCAVCAYIFCIYTWFKIRIIVDSKYSTYKSNMRTDARRFQANYCACVCE